jgi:YbgC/YbaW family acyl-CoA thioester hydrolase
MSVPGPTGPSDLDAPRSELTLRRRVQFYELDSAGIVHFSTYFRYMEEAEHALWRHAGLSIAPAGSDVGFPRVAVACDYHRPLRFEEEFDVRIRIVAMTEKSIRYSCVLTRGDDTIASGSLTVVCVRKTPGGTMKAVPIPSEIAGRFAVADVASDADPTVTRVSSVR